MDEIKKTNFTNNYEVNLKNKVSDNVKDDSEFICECEVNPAHGFIKLTGDRIGYFDSERTYYINKDGSGLLVTPWGKKEYKKGTISNVIKKTLEICREKGSCRLSKDEAGVLFGLVEGDDYS